MEEYMACRLFPLSVSFNLGEIADGETSVLKLAIPMPEFPVARRPEEMNDGFRVRVELAAVNVVGWYAYREHKVCVEAVPNEGRVNRVFEKAGIPYGPRLEPGFEACKEAMKKRKSDVGVGPSGKCTKVSGQKAVPAKMSVAPKGVSVVSLKTVLVKATHAKLVPKANVAPGTSVPSRTVAPSATAASKTPTTVAVTVTASRVVVLKISAGAKRPAVAPSLTVKGKQARVDARPPLASVVPHKVLLWPQVAVKVDDDRVAYCAMLDSVPSMESCSSSSSDSSGSASIMASPPPFPDLPISVELPHMIEVLEAEAVEQEVAVETVAHVASLKS
jgi:hypothetical protein